MANYLTNTEELTSVANAIRAKSGGSSPLEYPDGFVSEIESIPTGGGASVPPNDVNFLDYDGTIVRSYSATDFANLSAMPDNPTHEGLTAQGWNWTLSDAKAYVAAYGALEIGQLYVTDDGKTRLYITIDSDNKKAITIYYNQSIGEGVTVDWGDNSATEIDRNGGGILKNHNYVAIGDYIITLTPTEECTIKLGGSANVMGNSSGTHAPTASVLRKVEMGVRSTFWGYAFRWCPCLKTVSVGMSLTGATNWDDTFEGGASVKCVTIPNGVTYLGSHAFWGCSSLVGVSIPKGVTTISSSGFAGCPNLKRLTVPDSVTTLASEAFSGCTQIEKLTLPDGITEFKSNSVTNAYVLSRLKMPGSTANIANFAFASNTAMSVYDFSSATAVPTLAGTYAFNQIPASCIFLVPAALYDEWKAASNWSNYASKIVAV